MGNYTTKKTQALLQPNTLKSRKTCDTSQKTQTRAFNTEGENKSTQESPRGSKKSAITQCSPKFHHTDSRAEYFQKQEASIEGSQPQFNSVQQERNPGEGLLPEPFRKPSADQLLIEENASADGTTSNLVTNPHGAQIRPAPGIIKQYERPKIQTIETANTQTASRNTKSVCFKNYSAAVSNSTAQNSTHLPPAPSQAKKKHKGRARANCKRKRNTAVKSEYEIDEKRPVHPEGRWHPFTIDHSCTKSVGKNADLPPNVRRWLNVKQATGSAVDEDTDAQPLTVRAQKTLSQK